MFTKFTLRWVYLRSISLLIEMCVCPFIHISHSRLRLSKRAHLGSPSFARSRMISFSHMQEYNSISPRFHFHSRFATRRGIDTKLQQTHCAIFLHFRRRRRRDFGCFVCIFISSPATCILSQSIMLLLYFSSSLQLVCVWSHGPAIVGVSHCVSLFLSFSYLFTNRFGKRGRREV